MKVLFCSHSSGIAGAERSLLAIMMASRDRGHEGVVVVPAVIGELNTRARDAQPEFTVTSLPTHRWMGERQRNAIGLVRFIQTLGDIPAYYLLIRKVRPDVVMVASTVIPAPMVGAHLNRVPLVVRVAEAIDGNPSLGSVLPKRWIKLAIRRFSDSVICVSDFTAAQFVDCDFILPAPLTAPPFSERHAADRVARLLEGRPLRAVMLGSISPEKGQVRAVRAVAKAIQMGYEVTLQIYGSGSLGNVRALKRVIDEYGMKRYIQLRGQVSGVAQVFAAADVSLVCSLNEAFGRVTVESMLHGVPVIGMNRGGTSEILRGGGGILVDDLESMVDALVGLATNLDLYTRLTREAYMNPICDGVQRAAAEFVCVMEGVCQPGPEGGDDACWIDDSSAAT